MSILVILEQYNTVLIRIVVLVKEKKWSFVLEKGVTDAVRSVSVCLVCVVVHVNYKCV